MKLKDMPMSSSPSLKVMAVVAVLPKMVKESEQPNVESSSKAPTRILYSPVLTSHGRAMS